MLLFFNDQMHLLLQLSPKAYLCVSPGKSSYKLCK